LRWGGGVPRERSWRLYPSVELGLRTKADPGGTKIRCIWQRAPPARESETLAPSQGGRCQSCSPSTRRGEEEVRVLSSPKCAPDAGPEHDALRGLHATAQAADFRHGMKDYLVANVARGQRAVENSAVLISGRHVVQPRPLRCRTRVFCPYAFAQPYSTRPGAPPVGPASGSGSARQDSANRTSRRKWPRSW
jgi:hypothetical protein